MRCGRADAGRKAPHGGWSRLIQTAPPPLAPWAAGALGPGKHVAHHSVRHCAPGTPKVLLPAPPGAAAPADARAAPRFAGLPALAVERAGGWQTTSFLEYYRSIEVRFRAAGAARRARSDHATIPALCARPPGQGAPFPRSCPHHGLQRPAVGSGGPGHHLCRRRARRRLRHQLCSHLHLHRPRCRGLDGRVRRCGYCVQVPGRRRPPRLPARRRAVHLGACRAPPRCHAARCSSVGGTFARGQGPAPPRPRGW